MSSQISGTVLGTLSLLLTGLSGCHKTGFFLRKEEVEGELKEVEGIETSLSEGKLHTCPARQGYHSEASVNRDISLLSLPLKVWGYTSGRYCLW